jgi:hypothetical protein
LIIIARIRSTRTPANGRQAKPRHCAPPQASAQDFSHRINGAEASATGGLLFMPFGATRAFSVGAGTTTFNLVCNLISGSVSVDNPAMTALFVPGP